MKPYSRSASTSDLAIVMANIRDEDQQELASAYGEAAWPMAAHRTFEGSDWVDVGCDGHGLPFCIMGVLPSPTEGVGFPWFIASKEIDKSVIPFLRAAPGAVRKMHEQYEFLTNFVDARNLRTIDWLKWLGFEFTQDAIPFGVEERPFYPFIRKRHVS